VYLRNFRQELLLGNSSKDGVTSKEIVAVNA
jgi:hypothetical protein